MCRQALVGGSEREVLWLLGKAALRRHAVSTHASCCSFREGTAILNLFLVLKEEADS